tara:strand:+ start:944 stop:1630 length:687 start_codon:yes stop_codon:yes gene_type:complete
MKIISICQPHFIPWVGYFFMIRKCNKFIFLDDVQYNRRSWQNRVHIRSSHNINEKKYLSLSVKDNTRSKNINQIFLLEENLEESINQIKNSYRTAINFDFTLNFLENFLKKNISLNLSEFNILLIKEICKILKIKINFGRSSDFNLSNYSKEQLILKILKKENAKIYLSNEGSKKYVHESFFERENLRVVYNDFIHPTYKQLNSKNFLPNLSVIDLLFNSKDPHKFFL